MPHRCIVHLHYAGFAGADYDLQDALVESTNKTSGRGERHGQSFYDYELAGPVRNLSLVQFVKSDTSLVMCQSSDDDVAYQHTGLHCSSACCKNAIFMHV